MRVVRRPVGPLRARFAALLALSICGCSYDWDVRPRDAVTTEEMGGASGSGELADAEMKEPAHRPPDPDAEAEQLDGSPDEPNEPRDAGESDPDADAQGAARLAAVASVDTPCATPLEAACTGRNSTQKLICERGIWRFVSSCDGATRCDARFGITQGTCQPITSLCLNKRPGDAVCDGAMRKVCGEDLLDELPDPCPAHAHCEPGEPASCVCDSGFAPDANGACVDIVDCPPGACTPGGTCVEGTNRYACSCEPGYLPDPTQSACINVDDCPPNACGPGGTCMDLVGGYQCSCGSGYRPSSSGRGCVTACTATSCSPGTCTDADSGYRCTCPFPWVAAGSTPDYCYREEPLEPPCRPICP